MSSSIDNTKQALLALLESGCQGNIRDFRLWLEAENGITCSEEQLEQEIQQLIQSNQVCTHPEVASEYKNLSAIKFPNRVRYQVTSDLSYSPIQLVRSRLESFLSYHKARKSAIIDLSIATTEAMENAVKYSTDKRLNIEYSIEGDTFKIRIENEIKEAKPEHDIKSGKYSGSITLMRGMMVMVKLLDDVHIDIDDATNMAIFSATHRLEKVV